MPPRAEFPTRIFQVGDITATVSHLGVRRDEFPPHDLRDWWGVILQGPEPDMQYHTELGGSQDEYDRRDGLRRDGEWGAGPLGHVLYELNFAADEPDQWWEFEVGEETGRKAWDPRRDKPDVKTAREFQELAARFDGVIQPAYELWTNDWVNIVSQAVTP